MRLADPFKAGWLWARAHPLLAIVAGLGVIFLADAIVAWSLSLIQRTLGTAAFAFVGKFPFVLGLPFYFIPPLWPIAWIYSIASVAVFFKQANPPK